MLTDSAILPTSLTVRAEDSSNAHIQRLKAKDTLAKPRPATDEKTRERNASGSKPGTSKMDSDMCALKPAADLQICPCCEEAALLPEELDSHLQQCGIENRPKKKSSVSTDAVPSVESGRADSKPKKQKRQATITMKALKKLDEETQIALALSASLLPSEPPSRKKTSKTKLKFARPPPSLIERDPEDSRKIIADRVAAVVAKNCAVPSKELAGLPESRVGTESDEEEPTVKLSHGEMWMLSQMPEEEELDRFYVESLVPPLSRCKEAQNVRFRSLTQVPGFKLRLDLTQKNPPLTPVEFRTESAGKSLSPVKDRQKSLVKPEPSKSHHVRLVSSSSEDEDRPSTAAEPAALSPPPPESKCDEDPETDTDNQTLVLYSSSDESDIEVLPVEKRARTVKRRKAPAVPVPRQGTDQSYLDKLDGYTEKQLGKMLDRYGVQPGIGRARAISFLHYIYIHQKAAKAANNGIRSAQARKKKTKSVGQASEHTAETVAETLPVKVVEVSSTLTAAAGNVGDNVWQSSPEIPAPKSAVKQKKNPTKPAVKLVSSSESSDGEEAPSSEHAKESRRKKGVASPTKPAKPVKLKTPDEVREFMTTYIKEHRDLYEQILQYEIVYLKPFLKQLKENGFAIKDQLLMDFFDTQGIGFSQHNAAKPRPWGGRKTNNGKK